MRRYIRASMIWVFLTKRYGILFMAALLAEVLSQTIFYNFEDLIERPDRVKEKTDYIIINIKTLFKYAIGKFKEFLTSKEYKIVYFRDNYIILKKI